MKLTWFDSKSETLYINSKAILPDTKGLPFKEHCRRVNDAFKMTYPDRIEAYATEDQKKEILAAMEEHPGCKISEYMNA